MNIVDGVLVSVSSPPRKLVISGVRVIGERALAGSRITSVVISEGVVEIRNRAFMDCTELREVKLPSSLRKIGDFAFSSTHVDTIELPYAVQLGEEVFFDSWLTLVVSDVKIPLYNFPPGCRVVSRAQYRALQQVGADSVYKANERMLNIRIPRRPRREDDMPRMGKREAMRRAKVKPITLAKPTPAKPKKQSRARTPPPKPRSGECTICLKPSCEHLNMSRRLGAPIMW